MTMSISTAIRVMAKLKKMKVNLFEVVRGDRDQPLSDTLSELAQINLENRIKRIGATDMRLEHIMAPGDAGNATPYWMLDFVRFRDTHGPGKAARNAAIQGFDLRPEDFFGEETAALYDPDRNCLLLQYNHSGVKSSSIATYINNFFVGRPPSFYDFRMKLDETSEIRLAKKQHITKVHFKIAPMKVTAAHRAAGVSLDRVLELNNKHDGSNIEITISATRGSKLHRVNEMLDGLRAFRQADREQDTQVVTQFDLEAKAELEEAAEKINMLMPALVQQISGVEQGDDRRLTLKSRCEALARARRGWAQIIEG